MLAFQQLPMVEPLPSYDVALLRLATGLALAFIVTIFTAGVVAWIRRQRSH